MGSKASDVPTLLLNGMPSIFKYVDKVGHVYIVGTAEACRALNTWLASITGDSNGARSRISVVSEQSFDFKLDDMRGQLNSFRCCCVCAARTPRNMLLHAAKKQQQLRSVHAYYVLWVCSIGHDSKPGWIFQQCLKLYGHRMLSPKPR